MIHYWILLVTDHSTTDINSTINNLLLCLWI